jgi:hypothetical protein
MNQYECVTSYDAAEGPEELSLLVISSDDVSLADQFFTDGLLDWLADCGQQSLELT